MTELLQGPASVRLRADGTLLAVHTESGWCDVAEAVATWRVETDWWRRPARRDYVRCLLVGGDCVELYRDLETGEWQWARRLD